MKINITPDAKEYISREDIKVITIELYSTSTCCGVIFRPTVFKRAPKEEVQKHYTLYPEEGLDVWVENGATTADGELTVGHEKYLQNEILTAEGIKTY